MGRLPGFGTLVDASPFLSYISSHPLASYGLVFGLGLLASLSPCAIAVIPIVIGVVAGYAQGDTKKSVYYSLFFAVGLAITFTILGAIASLTGTLLGNVGGFWRYIIAAVAIAMGLKMLGILNFDIPQPKMQPIGQTGWLGALLLGMLFGVASSPCATPILATILTFVAARQNIPYGISLLFVYALAQTVVILAIGIGTGLAEAALKSQKFKQVSYYSYKISGIIFILVGVYFLIFKR